MLKIIKFALLTLIPFLATTNAAAEGQKLVDKLSNITISSEIKGCHADLQEFCKGLNPNSENAFLCLMAYEEKISNPCKLGIIEAAISIKVGTAAILHSASACEADADKFCLDVKPSGDGSMIRCIKKHQAEVSKACITALKNTGFWDMAK